MLPKMDLFSLGLLNFLSDSLKEMFLPVLQLSFKISHFQVSDDVMFCVVGLYVNRPTSGGVVTLKTGRREVQNSNPGRACRPSRSKFSVVFSETRSKKG